MIHPSYVELLKIMNDEAEENGTPHIDSRYSLVIAAAKRARQIIRGPSRCPSPWTRSRRKRSRSWKRAWTTSVST